MTRISDHPRLRRALLIGSSVVAGLLLLALALAAIDRTNSDEPAGESLTPSPGSTPTPTESPTGPPAEPSDDDTGGGEAVAPLPATEDPDEYAAATAAALFGMDYRRHDPAAYEQLFRDALWPDIATDAQAAIMSAITRRIPTPDMWEQMRSVKQTSKFTVDLVWEPRAGRDGREANQWPPGVVLRTVAGTRVESWRDEAGEKQTTRTETAVTVTVVCAPSSSPCRLVGIQPSLES